MFRLARVEAACGAVGPAGSLDHVTGSVDGVTLDGGLTATDVTFDAQGVSTSEPYTVATGSITGTLPTATIEQVVAEQTDLDVTVAVDGTSLVASGEVLGVDLSAALQPRVEDGRLLVDVGRMSLGGLTITVDDLPERVSSRFRGLEVPVSGLPEGLVLSAVMKLDVWLFGGIRSGPFFALLRKQPGRKAA